MAAPKADLTSKMPSLSELIDIAHRADVTRQAQEKTHGRLRADLDRRTAELDRSLESLPRSQRRQTRERALAAIRQELKAASADERRAHFKAVGALREQAQRAQRFYDSPVKMLVRHNLGSERRSRLIDQLRHSGPVELAHMAEVAASNGDRELAAVLVGRVSDLPAKDRPFNPHELATTVLGDDWSRVEEAFRIVDTAVQRVALAERDFEADGRPRGGPDRVTAGLRDRDRTGILDEDA